MVLCFAGAIAGCQGTGDKSAAGLSNPQAIEQTRQTLRQADPSALVGVVASVLPDAPYAAVTDLPAHEFKAGQVVTFINTDKEPITHGSVVRVINGTLHVRYDPPKAGGRAPRPGDLVIGFQR